MEKAMSDLDVAIERLSVLNAEIEEDRMESFYAKCAQLPASYLEEALRRHNAEIRHLENEVIPELMFKEGKRSVETLDGAVVKIKSEINASLKGANMDGLVEWLEARGYGAIVKKKLFLDQQEVSADQIERLEASGVHVYADADINTATLKKVLKEHYEKTDELPSELLTVSIFNHASLKFNAKEQE